jgi:hypothetical protein
VPIRVVSTLKGDVAVYNTLKVDDQYLVLDAPRKMDSQALAVEVRSGATHTMNRCDLWSRGTVYCAVDSVYCDIDSACRAVDSA